MLEGALEAFGFDADAVATAGPRGALGQIWRVDAGRKVFALKEIFAEPPDVDAELRFTTLAAQAGVRFPASHPDREGRYLLERPAGRWWRLYDWLDLQPIDRLAASVPEALGSLLARLHLCAPAAVGDQNPWYHTVSEAHDFDGWLVQPDPDSLILCHRDLHPENVLAGPDGGLVVLDWDNFGPAVPGRELASGLFDWFCDGTADLDAMGRMYRAYVREGGPGRITGRSDFTMLLATRLNFLHLQTRILHDPRTEPKQREWAQREVDQFTQIMPTPRQLEAVLALTST